MWVCLVIDQFKVIEFKVVDRLNVGVEFHFGEWMGGASELKLCLFEVIGVEVEVAKGVDKVTGLVSADLGDHQREQSVRGDVEGDTEEEIGTALVELAGQSWGWGVGVVDVELEKKVAGWQGHVVDKSDVPSGDEVASRGGVVFEILNEASDLVDGGSVRAGPGAPLLAVDWAEVSFFVGPFVPDSDFVVLEVLDVGVSFEEPEEFVNDGAEVEFFGGEAGKSLGEVVAGLAAKDAESSSASAVSSFFAVFEDIGEEVEVLLHWWDGGELGFKIQDLRFGIWLRGLVEGLHRRDAEVAE